MTKKKYLPLAMPPEYIKRKTKVCANCEYFGVSIDLRAVSRSPCDYIGVTGKRRPCKAEDCVKAGVFKKKSHKRKRAFMVKV